MENSRERIDSSHSSVAALLGVGRCCDWNSRLCRWGVGAARESFAQTFYNQAFNTLFNYGSKGLRLIEGVWHMRFDVNDLLTAKSCLPLDARKITELCDLWITDPPYADAINYEELSEFFLAWYEKKLPNLFPDWYSDSKRALAVKGHDDSFRRSMVDSYKRLVECLPDNGLQVVMFTHQDAAVWADLAIILWTAGLSVVSAWCVATETDAVIKEGNYVQGTVLLVLRKRTEEQTVFLDEIVQRVETEVKRQLDTMIALDDESDPNFGDADYQLAAYAAALRVLTERPIEEIDPSKEILRQRKPGRRRSPQPPRPPTRQA